MKLSVCIDAVFRGTDSAEAMRQTREAGIGAVEFWSWWDKDLDAIRKAKDEYGLEVAAFCTKFVTLLDPEARGDYIRGLKESIEAAGRLGCKRLITQTGADRRGVERAVQTQHMIDGLRECAPLLEASDITLLVEPLNTAVNHPGYFLSSSEETFALLREVGSPNVKALYDIYHQQITEGDLIRRMTANLPLIGHLHAAGHPGRHELHIGEINYPYVFKALREAGYGGYVGLEYFGVGEPAAGLAQAAEFIGERQTW